MFSKYIETTLGKMGAFSNNTLFVMAYRVVGATVIFLLHILLARSLGVSEYGTYSFVISCISILALLGTLGFDTSLTRFLPEYIHSKQWGFFHGLIKYSFRICLLASALIVTAVCIGSYAIDHFESRSSLIMALPLLIVVVLTNIRITILRSLKNYTAAILPETIVKPVMFICFIFIAYVSGLTLTSKEAIVMQFIAASITFVIGGHYLKRSVINNSIVSKPTYHKRYWLLSSLPMLLTSGSAFVISQTDIIMLGLLKDFYDSGVYSAVSRLAGVAIFFMAAINFVIAPMVSEAYHKQDENSLNNLVQKCTKLSFFLALVSFLVFILFGQYFLGLFGEDFVSGYFALIILLLGHLFNTASGPVGLLLSLTGSQFFAAKVMIACALLNVGFNFFLINIYGLLGAAISTMITTMLWNYLMFLKVRTSLNINASIFGNVIDEKS